VSPPHRITAPPEGAGGLLVDARALTGQRTGIGVWLGELVQRWVALGHEVVLLTVAGGPPGLGTHLVEVGRPFHVGAWREARRRQLPYLSPDSLIAPVALGRQATVAVHDVVPLVVPTAQPARTRWAFRLLLGAATRRCGSIVVPSQSTRSDLLRLFPASADRLHVVAEGARSMPAPSPLPSTVRPPYVLYTGTLEPRKHPLELVDAFTAVAPPGWQLVLAGKRGWLDAVQLRRLDALRGSRQVLELGFVRDDVLAGLLHQAEALVYPSAYEGFGLPVLEGMAAGLPVLTTNAPALREVAGDAALLVDLHGRDPFGAGLRDALQRLLQDAALRDHLRAAGQRQAARFSWDTAARALWPIVTGAAGRAVPDGPTRV
jgi:glycosyltransferase involved in cell wall biosynthesis